MKPTRSIFLSSSLLLLALVSCSDTKTIPEPPSLVGLEEDVAKHLRDTYEKLRDESARLNGSELGKVYGESAMTYHAYDLPLMARRCYESAMALDPREAKWVYLLSRVELQIGNLEEALALLESVLVIDPEHLPSQVSYADLHLKVNSLQRAKNSYLSILNQNPQCVPALAGLGKIALQQGNAPLAAQRLEEALVLSPGASGLRYPYGLALRQVGSTALAVKQMEARGDALPRVQDAWIEEVRNRPVGARIPLNRGITFFKEGLYERAELEFKKSVVSAPESASAHLNLGSAYVKRDKPELARHEFNEAIRLDPESTMAWFNLGVIHAAMSNDLEAIHCYDQALLIETGMPEALFNRANALRRLKKYQEAAHEMKKVRNLRPGNTSAWLAESVCYFRVGQEDEALNTCRQGRLSTANEARLVSLEARLLATMSSSTEEALQKSITEIDQLLEQEKALEYVESKAMLLAALEDFEIALQWQEAAIQAAKSAGESEIVRRLEGNRSRYSQGLPADDPWPEPDSSPPPTGTSEEGPASSESTGESSEETTSQ